MLFESMIEERDCCEKKIESIKTTDTILDLFRVSGLRYEQSNTILDSRLASEK